MPARKRSREDMDEGARKKLKSSRRGERSNVSPPPEAIIDISSDRDIPAQVDPLAAPSQDSESFKALQLLHADFESLRSLITCKICERLLYEPYVLSCGHTYCYSCLTTWFQGKKKKTCPNCRDDVRHMPAPSYVIKEMTTVFIGRTELLPDGETIEQHAQWQKEESDIVQKDKADEDARTGGLFRGSFKPAAMRAGPIIDREDNVERCPECGWELEDGYCNACGTHFDDDIGSDDDISDDVSDELDDEAEIDEDDFDAHDADFGHAQVYDAGIYGGGSPNHLHFHAYAPNLYNLPRRYDHVLGDSDEEEDSDDEDDDDHSLHGFIDDEADVSDASDAQTRTSDIDGHSSVHSTPRRRRRLVIVDSDDEEAGNPVSAGAYHGQPSFTEEDEDSDSSSDVAHSRPNPQSRRAPQITIVDSEDEDLDSDSDVGSSEDQESEDELPYRLNEHMVNFSSPVQDESENEANTNDVFSDDDQHSDDETGVDDAFLRGEQSGFSPMQSYTDEEQESYDEDEENHGAANERFQWPGRPNGFVAASTLHRPHPASSMPTGSHYPVHSGRLIARMPGNLDINSVPSSRVPIQNIGARVRPPIPALHRHQSNAVSSTLPPPLSPPPTYRTAIGNHATTARSHAPIYASGAKNSIGNRGASGRTSQQRNPVQYSVSAESVDSETDSDSDDASSSETMGRSEQLQVQDSRAPWEAEFDEMLGPLPTFPLPGRRPSSLLDRVGEIMQRPSVSNFANTTLRPMTFEEMYQHRRIQRSNNMAPALQLPNARATRQPLLGRDGGQRSTAPMISLLGGHASRQPVASRVASKPRPNATVVNLISDDESV